MNLRKLTIAVLQIELDREDVRPTAVSSLTPDRGSHPSSPSDRPAHLRQCLDGVRDIHQTQCAKRGGLLDRFRLATLDHPERYPADRLVWLHLDEHSSGHDHGTPKG